MTMESITNTYASKKVILQFPDDYVARAQYFDEQSKLAVKENGRYIVKAGTPFPANDATATGIVLNDLDVTNGDANGAVLVRGHINTAKAEDNAGITYTQACKTALKGIFFYPLGGEIAETTTLDAITKVAIGAKDPVIEFEVAGTDFAPKQASAKLTNYTITNGAGLTASAVTRVSDKVVKIAFTGTAAAGNVKVKALAAAVVNGVASNEVTVTVA